jgi:hypothetical protein
MITSDLKTQNLMTMTMKRNKQMRVRQQKINPMMMLI